MQLRMTIDDSLYARYKKLADANGYAITKLNEIIFEKALNEWIREIETKTVGKCDICGSATDRVMYYYNGPGLIEAYTHICEECYNKMYKVVEMEKDDG